jgi:hypothetical protein
MQLTNWQILMRHIVRYWKSAAVLQDSGKEKFHIHFFCLETLQLGDFWLEKKSWIMAMFKISAKKANSNSCSRS